jgi:hypothetical protein
MTFRIEKAWQKPTLVLVLSLSFLVPVLPACLKERSGTIWDASSCCLAQHAHKLPTCGGRLTPLNGGFAKALAADVVQWTGNTVDVGLDRQSFLDRGWKDGQLGTLNTVGNSSFTVTVSLLYAVQVGDVSVNRDKGHAHREAVLSHLRGKVEGEYRGLGAQIDDRARAAKRFFHMYAYDVPNPPTRRFSVVCRNRNEYPFNQKGPFQSAAGVAPGPNGEIFIAATLTDGYAWALGEKLDKGGAWQEGTQWKLNLTTVISHEAGHCFGLDHINVPGSIMQAECGPGKRSWGGDELSKAISQIASHVK